MSIEVIADLINNFGVGIAALILFVFLFFLLRKEASDTIKRKDAELKEANALKDAVVKDLTEKVIQLQEKSIGATNSLVNAINVNTEVTRKVDTHLENTNQQQQTLLNNIYQVLNNVKK